MPTPINNSFSSAICASVRALAFASVLFALGCSDNGKSANSNHPNNTKPDSASVKTASTTNTTEKSLADPAPKAGKSTTTPEKAAPDVEPEKVAETLPKKVQVSTEPDANEPEFHEAILAATKDYLRFGMVNSIVLPASEAGGSGGEEAPKPLMSESEHEASHGKKLYFLFAKEIGHYVNPEGKPTPVGQVIVQESWTSSPANSAARNLVNHASGNRINPRAKVGDKTLEIGQRKNFFVMTKLKKDTPKTDEGWVYGIVDADTRKVLASGKVASCMSCHVGAANDRLFGSKHVILETPQTSEVEAPKQEPAKKEVAKKEASKKEALKEADE